MAVLGAAALSLAAVAYPACAQERLVGTYGEARTILAFKVSDAALQKLLPEGWQSSPVGAGPSKEANLTVSFVDQLVAQGPDGKPEPGIRIAAVSVPAKKMGTEATVALVLTGFSSDSSYVPGAYGNFTLAEATVERSVRTDPAGTSGAQESWQFSAGNGDSLELQLQYVHGVAARGKVEAKVHSGKTPDFYRIYRIEQAVDVVRSTATGMDRAQKFSFKASGQQFAQLFDGSEQLISISSLPWYTRQVFLPSAGTQ